MLLYTEELVRENASLLDAASDSADERGEANDVVQRMCSAVERTSAGRLVESTILELYDLCSVGLSVALACAGP